MPRERRNPPSEELYARKWPIFAVTMVGLFMALIDVTIVNITIPTLQHEFDAPVDTVSWVLNAYNIMFAVLLVSMGRLADQFGRRSFFIGGMTIFTVGSFLCAISGTIGVLIGFRVLQAVGAAILAPLALATTALVFPPKQRGLGLALMAVVANTAAAVGPPLGGLLVEYASWHWIFLVNVPIGVVGVALALRVMPETFDLTSERNVDWYGMVLLGGSIFCLTYGLVEANSHGWGSPEIVSLFVGAAVLALAFAFSQRLGRWPMLVPSLLRNRQFMSASGAMTLFAVAVMGPLFLAVLAFVNMWGYSQLKAALAIAPISLLGLVVSPLVGRRADTVPPRLMAVPAMLIMGVGLIWLAELPARPDYLSVLPALALMGIGMGAIFPSVNVGGMGSVSGQELGLGSGIANMSRQLGFAIGVAVLVAVFTGVLDDRTPAARNKADTVLQQAGYSPQRREAVLKRVFFSRSEQASERVPPRNDAERQVAGLAAGAARDGFAAGFRVAALFLLLAVPFAFALRRPPAAAHAAAGAADAGPPAEAEAVPATQRA
ncbi:MAG TPA: MFS transporter [Thermoleophilaceae bacterium]